MEKEETGAAPSVGRQRKGFYCVLALNPTLLSHGDYYCKAAKSEMCMLSGIEVHSSEIKKSAKKFLNHS